MSASSTEPKYLILHQDDVGMCHGSNLAFEHLTRFGTCSSGSVMVPCPWFLEAADIAARGADIDLGVHLTLTSEKSIYRWRPLTGASRSSGLTDDLGFFWADVPSLRMNAKPGAVEEELRAQIELAYSVGIDVTHLDAHMGAALAPEFSDIYLKLAKEYRLPILVTPRLADYGPRHNLGAIDPNSFDKFAKQSAAAGITLIDLVLETVWKNLPNVSEVYRDMILSSEGQITFFSLHFNAPGDIEAIDTPESARARIAEFELFGSSEFQSWLETINREIVGFRAIRDSFREDLRRNDGREAPR